MGTRRSTPGLDLAALLTLTGCSGAESSAAPTSTEPLPPPACRYHGDTPKCLPALAALIEREARQNAGGERVTHEDVLDALGSAARSMQEHGPLNAYHLETPLGDADVEETATTPIKTTWDLGDVQGSLWACFGKGTVRVQQQACR